jgi:hypothetical protein
MNEMRFVWFEYSTLILILIIIMNWFDVDSEWSGTSVLDGTWITCTKRIYSKKSDVWSFAIVGEWVCLHLCVLSDLFTFQYISMFSYMCLCLWYLYFELNWIELRELNIHTFTLTHILCLFLCVDWLMIWD